MIFGVRMSCPYQRFMNLNLHSRPTQPWFAHLWQVLAAIGFVFAWGQAFADVPQVQILDQAYKTPGARQPGLAATPAVTVSLPDRWAPAPSDSTWVYRLNVDPASCTSPGTRLEPCALWIKALGGDIRIWVNGQLLADVVGAGGGPDDSLRRPLLAVVPQALLRPGINTTEIELRSTGAPSADGLSRVWWGPAHALQALHATREQRILGTSYAVAFAAAIGCLGAVFAAVRLARPEAWLFFLASLFWALREVVLLLGPWGERAASMAQVTVMAQGVAVCSAVLLMLRLLPDRHPLATRTTGLILLGLPFAAYLTQGHQATWRGVTLLHAGWIIPGTLMIFASMRSLWVHRTRVVTLIAGANLVSAVLMNMDIWQLHLGNSPMGLEHLPLTSYLLLTFSLVVSVSALLRIGDALRKEQNQSSELYRQVRLQRNEIDALYRSQAERQKSEAVAAERSRIVRDMHDGLGSQLVGLMSTVQSANYSRQELTQEVSDALDELRMTIDTLEPMDDDLVSTLGQLRFRLEPRLRHCGIQVKWSMEGLPNHCAISPLAQTHVRRLLYETFTNVIKHAHASAIHVTGHLDQALKQHTIVVQDNGIGFDVSTQMGGRGLSNMKARAKLMGADIEISSAPNQGTRIKIGLPIQNEKQTTLK